MKDLPRIILHCAQDENKQLIAALSLPLILLLLAIWRIVPAYIPAHIKDKLELIILVLFFGSIFFYVIFRVPASDTSIIDRYVRYVHLYSPENEAELALLKSILDSESINYFVTNDNFGSLEVGPRIGLYNSKTIEVRDDQYELANELLSDYFEKTKIKPEEQVEEYSLFDKIRMIIEVLVFGWLMPGRRNSKKIDD